MMAASALRGSIETYINWAIVEKAFRTKGRAPFAWQPSLGVGYWSIVAGAEAPTSLHPGTVRSLNWKVFTGNG